MTQQRYYGIVRQTDKLNTVNNKHETKSVNSLMTQRFDNDIIYFTWEFGHKKHHHDHDNLTVQRFNIHWIQTPKHTLISEKNKSVFLELQIIMKIILAIILLSRLYMTLVDSLKLHIHGRKTRECFAR